jgi:TonB family protein
MKPAHLFEVHPNHSAAPGARTWDPNATKASFTDDQITQFRLRLVNNGDLPPCPHCASRLGAEAVDIDEHERTWNVSCDVCGSHVNIRAFLKQGPKAPAFGTLIVSNPKGNRVKDVAPRSTLSMIVHGILIYAAVVATQSGGVVNQVIQDTSMVFLTLDAEDQKKPEPEPEENQPAQIVTLNPAPKGFQTVDAPLTIPTDIPPIDLSQRFDPRDFSGTGVEGGIFAGVEGGTGPVQAQLQSHTFLEAAVDEPPERISGPALRYPEMLRQANIEGMVIFEFVVAADGTVEEQSIVIIMTSNDGFVLPAREVIQKSRFRPGRVRGVPVRVLVRQTVSFNIIQS